MTMFFSSIFFLLLLIFSMAEANLNLFISKDEMNRTLGVNAEMNYIDGGVVNGYSTKFPYRVEAHIDHLTFSWSAAGKVSYIVRAESEDSAVLPVLRMQSFGEVPNNLKEFSVEYRCAGYRSGQFIVALYFNFTTQNGERITTKLRQEKICASRDGRRGLAGGMDGDQDFFQRETLESADNTFYIIIGIAALFLLIIGTLLISYFRKSKKDEPPSGARTPSIRMPASFRSSFRARSGASAQPFLTSTPLKEKGGSFPSGSSSGAPTSLLGTSSIPSTSTASHSLPPIIKDKPSNVDVSKALLALHADRELFQMLPFVDCEGTFGEVRFAIWRQTEDPSNGDIDDEEDAPCTDEAVMCKTLKKHCSPQQLEKFLAEVLVFHKLPPHANLAQVVCAASFGRFDVPSSVVDLPLICYRHRGFGNLKKFLLNCKDGDKKGSHTLRTHDLSSLCLQLSRAVAHLHRMNVLHKDLATRNCLISECSGRLSVQLCDSALSRDMFPAEYHCMADNENRPIRWMSPEAIEQNRFTSATDIWSLGVLCWEVVSLGCLPYPMIDPDDLLGSLRSGLRLEQPKHCPDQIFSVMFCCWRDDPRERPTADQITLALQDFSVQLTQFV